MSYDKNRVESHVVDILTAYAPGWWDNIAPLSDAKRSTTAITNARIQTSWEILEAIAGNPEHSYFGSMAALVTVAHNAQMPAYDGQPGIPVIVPFNGGPVTEAIPASPTEIDSYRNNAAIYSGAVDGVAVAHDAADANGKPSPISSRYSIVNGRFKFTGFTAQIPLIQITRTMADSGMIEAYEPAIVRGSILKLVKAGDNLFLLAPTYMQMWAKDLADIKSGATQVQPMPIVELAQKAGIV